MKTLKTAIIAIVATVLTGCGVRATNDEPVTAASLPATTPTTVPVTTPVTIAPPTTATPTDPAAPPPAKPQETIQTSGARIDASAFLNALVESGCQIDKAEYKEVKRGGAIKVVCSKTVDPLNVELDNF